MFRYALGVGLIIAGCVFLTINSVILGHAASKLTQSMWDTYAYTTVAVLVPWIIAIVPFVIVAAYKLRHWGWGSVAVLLYVVFVGYNWTAAGGAVALVRGEVIDKRAYEHRTEQRREDRRTGLVQQRAAIPAGTRPEAAVRGLIEREQAKPLWEQSGKCRDASNRRERDYCQGLAALRAELGAAQQLAKITSDLEELDGKLEASGPTAGIADIEALQLATIICAIPPYCDEEKAAVKVARWKPLMLPTVLELGAMFLMGFGIVCLGLNHKVLMGFGEAGTQDAGQADGGSGSRPRASAPPLKRTDIPQADWQVELCTWFFANCARPVGDNVPPMTEAQWYRVYSTMVQQQGDMPLTVMQFARVAEKFVTVKLIGGQTYYAGVLPLTPAKAA
jgi:hypothetical protein